MNNIFYSIGSTFNLGIIYKIKHTSFSFVLSFAKTWTFFSLVFHREIIDCQRRQIVQKSRWISSFYLQLLFYAVHLQLIFDEFQAMVAASRLLYQCLNRFSLLLLAFKADCFHSWLLSPFSSTGRFGRFCPIGLIVNTIHWLAMWPTVWQLTFSCVQRSFYMSHIIWDIYSIWYTTVNPVQSVHIMYKLSRPCQIECLEYQSCT